MEKKLITNKWERHHKKLWECLVISPIGSHWIWLISQFYLVSLVIKHNYHKKLRKQLRNSSLWKKQWWHSSNFIFLSSNDELGILKLITRNLKNSPVLYLLLQNCNSRDWTIYSEHYLKSESSKYYNFENSSLYVVEGEWYWAGRKTITMKRT